MRTAYPDPPRPNNGGWPPPQAPPGPDVVDEGPMRAELLRQIGHLEIDLGQFASVNRPYDAVVASPQRGQAILATADLEATRDELLAARSMLHDLMVQRVLGAVGPRAGTAARRRPMRSRSR